MENARVASKWPPGARSPAQALEFLGMTIQGVKEAQRRILGFTPQVNTPGVLPATVQTLPPSRVAVADGASEAALGEDPEDNFFDPFPVDQLKLWCAELTLQKSGSRMELCRRLKRFIPRLKEMISTPVLPASRAAVAPTSGGVQPPAAGIQSGYRPPPAATALHTTAAPGSANRTNRRVNYRDYIGSGTARTVLETPSNAQQRANTVVVVDSREREVQQKSWREHLADAGHPFDSVTRFSLPIGDFCFLQRDSQAPTASAMGTTAEFSVDNLLMLQGIVERKRLDDLASSVIDSRYQAQKRILSRCGVTPVVYLLEGHNTRMWTNDPSVRQRCETAALTSMLVDGFHVYWSASAPDSAALMAALAAQQKHPLLAVVPLRTFKEWCESVQQVQNTAEGISVLPRMLATLRGCSYQVAVFLAKELGTLRLANVKRVQLQCEQLLEFRRQEKALKRKTSRKRTRELEPAEQEERRDDAGNGSFDYDTYLTDRELGFALLTLGILETMLSGQSPLV
jgi:ERCC4-type nuclease